MQAGQDRDELLSALGLDDVGRRLRRRLGAPVDLTTPTLVVDDAKLSCAVSNLNEVPLRPMREAPVQDVVVRVAAEPGPRSAIP